MIQFQGTRQEFGEYYGLRLREFHHDFFHHTNKDTLRRQLRLYEKFYPELVAEKYAAAAILHQDPQYLLYEDLASPIDAQRRRVNPHQHGCTIFAIRENGKVFVGRNYDWLPEAREFFERYDIAIKDSNRYFAFPMNRSGGATLDAAVVKSMPKMLSMNMGFISVSLLPKLTNGIMDSHHHI